MTDKKVVHYTEVLFWKEGGVGSRAFVIPVDHPDTELVSNAQMATTSEVVAYDETSEIFETQNTVYVPA